MTHCWSESQTGKPKYSQKYLSHCHFAYHIYHLDRPSTEPGLPRYETGD